MTSDMLLTADAVVIPDAPALPGLVFRRFRGEEDYAGMTAVLQAANAADGIGDFISTEELTADFIHASNFDPRRDLLIAEVDGVVAAFSRVNWYEEDDGTRIYSFFGELHPDWRRKGIGRAMVRHTERRAHQIAANHSGSAPRLLQSFAYDSQRGAEALLRQEGYRAMRHSFAMMRPHLDDLPDAPLPPGIEVRPAYPEHFRAIWEAKEEAFRDHWGHRAPTEDKYRGWLNDPFFDPDLWQVAWDAGADQVVGTVLTFVIPEENGRLNRRRGYTEGIAVRRSWRRRGVATALLVRSLRQLKALGFTEAALHVDGENPSGALKLYESVGFHAVRRESVYRKSLGQD